MTSYILQPIRNNFVAAASSGLDGSPDGFDTGIGLERDTAPDVGADEYGYPVFIDGFELGDTSRWSTVVP